LPPAWGKPVQRASNRLILRSGRTARHPDATALALKAEFFAELIIGRGSLDEGITNVGCIDDGPRAMLQNK
jgi:hypothetical protein